MKKFTITIEFEGVTKEVEVTQELVQDLKAIMGLDPVEELKKIIGTEVVAAMDEIALEWSILPHPLKETR